MKEFQPGEIRNFCLVGHFASGKTMLSEAILASAGGINRMGSVTGKNTVSDYHVAEHTRQMSIHSSLLTGVWLDKKMNFIDTPGHADFVGESIGALGVSDFAVIVVHAGHGIEAGTEQAWELAEHFDIPKIIVVNALDKEHVDFEKLYGELRERFGSHVFPFSWPVNQGPGFQKIIDIPRDEVITYATDQSGKFTESAPSGDWKKKVDVLHKQLIEIVAESDDQLLEKFFAQGGLSEQEWRAGIHAAVQKKSIIPVFAVSAERNVGVSRLLDFIAKYGSSPVDRKTVKAMDDNGRPAQVDLAVADPVLFVFKTLGEEHVGELSYFRVYSGAVATGTELLNTANGSTEHIGQLFVLNGNKRETVKKLNAGDIGAAVKMKNTHTGNTLASPSLHVSLPQPELPTPTVQMAIRPKAAGDEERMIASLLILHEEDPTFNFRYDPERRQTLVTGRGELHLEVTMERLKERFKIDAMLTDPHIPYRETIRIPAEALHRHKKQSASAGQFTEVGLHIEPRERDAGVEFDNKSGDKSIDRALIAAVEAGILAACEDGGLAGFPVTDVKVDFTEGKQLPADSKDEAAYQMAAKETFREAFLAASPCILEPVMALEIRTPEQYVGVVMGDISSRRGTILNTETRGNVRVIQAEAPQAELRRYNTALRSLTGGNGSHSETFSRYAELPAELERQLLQERKKA